MIAIFTDYGLEGPYLGQVEVVLYEASADTRVITLLADAPAHNPRAAAYLLSAFSRGLPANTVVFAVVDPGVGSDEDRPVIIKADDRWYVGPDNGLFNQICKRSVTMDAWAITWRPDNISSTFHGRDLYAPVCAMLAREEAPPGDKIQWADKHQWPDDLYEVIYIDHFGNVMSGIQTGTLSPESVLEFAGHELRYARTFSDVDPGQGFWYENSSGLIEIAVNQGSAKELFNAKVSDPLIINK